MACLACTFMACPHWLLLHIRRLFASIVHVYAPLHAFCLVCSSWHPIPSFFLSASTDSTRMLQAWRHSHGNRFPSKQLSRLLYFVELFAWPSSFHNILQPSIQPLVKHLLWSQVTLLLFTHLSCYWFLPHERTIPTHFIIFCGGFDSVAYHWCISTQQCLFNTKVLLALLRASFPEVGRFYFPFLSILAPKELD